jgi:hypothetical protein
MTNWDAPKTERDLIRSAFRNQGRLYPIPATVAYPAAHYIVPHPTKAMEGTIVRWWEKKAEEQEAEKET